VPLIVICAVGLTPAHLGPHTPALTELAERGFSAPMQPTLPALTASSQSSMLTGVQPSEHGIVGNGWYFRDLGEVWLWRQSERLLCAPTVWRTIRTRHPRLKVLKHFWWYAMNSDADVFATPRPAYHADGAKSPDCYTWPPELKTTLIREHGEFPLFRFWGPTADVRSSRWIAEAFVTAWNAHQPDLSFCYLPHLDYDLQRFGPEGEHLPRNLREIDDCCRVVLEHADRVGADVLVVSEYGLEAVDRAVFINRRLREAGLLQVTVNATGELLDPGTSRAFAVADHQIAHVYCRRAEDVAAADEALADVPGIERCYRGAERAEIGLDHARSGEIIALATPGARFTYDYWLDDARRPDFANNVEIHKKPGYDPRELFFDPHGGKLRALKALVRKKLGFRYLMNPVSLDTALVRGSHGRPPSSPDQGPVIIGSRQDWAGDGNWKQIDVATLIDASFK